MWSKLLVKTFALLMLLFSCHAGAQESVSEQDPPQRAEETEQQPSATDEDSEPALIFDPSEEISEDLSVSFPTDI